MAGKHSQLERFLWGCLSSLKLEREITSGKILTHKAPYHSSLEGSKSTSREANADIAYGSHTLALVQNVYINCVQMFCCVVNSHLTKAWMKTAVESPG